MSTENKVNKEIQVQDLSTLGSLDQEVKMRNYILVSLVVDLVCVVLAGLVTETFILYVLSLIVLMLVGYVGIAQPILTKLSLMERRVNALKLQRDTFVEEKKVAVLHKKLASEEYDAQREILDKTKIISTGVLIAASVVTLLIVLLIPMQRYVIITFAFFNIIAVAKVCYEIKTRNKQLKKDTEDTEKDVKEKLEGFQEEPEKYYSKQAKAAKQAKKNEKTKENLTTKKVQTLVDKLEDNIE